MTDTIPMHLPDLVAGLYRPMRQGRWELRRGGLVLTRGYWSPPQLVPDIVALLRDGETWMSMTPMEIESQAIGVANAHGHVAIFGMGMGWAAAVCALRSEVSRVTVVEQDPDVIEMLEALRLFAALPGNAGAKITVEAGDAYDWVPERPVDFLMADIWLPLVSGDRIAEMKRMQANVSASHVYFWGQELEIARHVRAAGRTLDDRGIAAAVTTFGLPLVGPGPGYAKHVQAAAAAWMRDRWLD